MYGKIKEAVSMHSAAERYGLELNARGFARCPFHEEKTASFKIYDNSFYCFGCGAGGDVITFAAKLYGVGNAQAALHLIEDFGLCLTADKPAPARSEYLRKKAEKKRETESFRRDYLSKCERFRSLDRELETAKGMRRAEITAELEYLEYYFESTRWR